MFKFFKRLSTVVGSELNAMLDKAEDPVKMLEQYIREMAEDIREMETAVARQVANEKMLKRKADDARAMADKRQYQAEQALATDDEELARKALEGKGEYDKQASMLNESWDQATEDSKVLKSKLDEMKKEFQEMKLKKDTLTARAESAKTKAKMNRTMSSIGNDDSRRGFERMEEKVMQYEAEAETTEDISTESRTLDDTFDEMEKNKAVDDEFKALKKKMGKD
ncbi:PspA/IM30 family protein [Virgibacillus siamensis]|uniref:PspA/IM30 family protein n=1 Tax=Virgibacillus siamensis TaxID=480071 RepID=UPI000985186A|nr:PspA/IM30 family protein [Virgibacillus siamensis]